MTREEADWTPATWEGSRRAQLRRSLELSVLERLEALDELTRTSDALVVRREASGGRTSERPDRG